MFKNKKILIFSSILLLTAVSAITVLLAQEKSKEVLSQNNFKNKINIAYSTDENYIFPTLVSMTSLMENADNDSLCNITILISKGVSKEDKNKLKSIEKNYSNCKVSLVDMNNQFENSEKNFWSTAMYYRLNLPQILNEEKRCIYIDGDTIIRKSLTEMYSFSLDDYYIAGVRDFNGYINSESSYHQTLDISDLNSYICSGVLIMNLEKMRNDNLNEVFEKLVEENNSKKIFGFPDQDILNKACYGKILCIPFKYGALVHTNFENSFADSDYAKWASSEEEWEEGRKDPVIVHFTGPKPWTSLSSRFSNEWWQYAEKTNYKNEIKRVYPI